MVSHVVVFVVGVLLGGYGGYSIGAKVQAKAEAAINAAKKVV